MTMVCGEGFVARAIGGNNMKLMELAAQNNSSFIDPLITHTPHGWITELCPRHYSSSRTFASRDTDLDR